MQLVQGHIVDGQGEDKHIEHKRKKKTKIRKEKKR